MLEQFRSREPLIRILTRLAPQIIQGSEVTLKGPCGKTSCACARDLERQHLRHYLSWTEAGCTRMLYIPSTQLQAFQWGTQTWTQFKHRAQQLGRLNAQILKSQESKIPRWDRSSLPLDGSTLSRWRRWFLLIICCAGWRRWSISALCGDYVLPTIPARVSFLSSGGAVQVDAAGLSLRHHLRAATGGRVCAALVFLMVSGQRLG